MRDNHIMFECLYNTTSSEAHLTFPFISAGVINEMASTDSSSDDTSLTKLNQLQHKVQAPIIGNKYRAHSHSIGSTDSGYDSIKSVKSETELTKMTGTESTDALTFDAWMKEKLTGCDHGTMIVGEDYVGALLNDIGGNLEIESKGVYVHVPPGALQKQQLVYAHILPPSVSSGPRLQEEATCVTPIVECGPPGLTFRKKVHVTIPHCASSSEWQATVHRDDHCRGRQWKTMENDDANIINANGAFTFETIHFSWFILTMIRQQDREGEVQGEQEQGNGEDNEDEGTFEDQNFKWMKPVVFRRPTGDGSCEVTVQICDMEYVKVSTVISYTHIDSVNSSNAFFPIIPCEQAILPMTNEL